MDSVIAYLEYFLTSDVHVWLGVGLAAALIMLAYSALFLHVDSPRGSKSELSQRRPTGTPPPRSC